MEQYLIRTVDILTILSNLFFLIPSATAFSRGWWIRGWVFFWMVWASFVYHLCDSFNVCIFSFTAHHHIDFFFAQFLIVQTALFFPFYSPKYKWVEPGLMVLGAIGLIVLQLLLPADLGVQAAIVVVAFIAIVIYWIVYTCTNDQKRFPPYNWIKMLLSISLIGCSITLYTVQNLWPDAYWGVHSLWHTAAAFGQHYFLFIKPEKKVTTIKSARNRY